MKYLCIQEANLGPDIIVLQAGYIYDTKSLHVHSMTRHYLENEPSNHVIDVTNMTDRELFIVGLKHGVCIRS